MKRCIKVILAAPRGFCAGVERAIAIVEKALAKYGSPIYVKHEIVHNKYVVDSLKAKGVVFVEEISDIPGGAIVVFSAHGVAEQVEVEAKSKNLHTLDATCPLVTKVHLQAKRYEQDDCQLIIIGHEGHPEVVGTSGRVQQDVILVSSVYDAKTITPSTRKKLAYVTQTTLSMDDTKEIIDILKSRFPEIIGPDTKDICYATQNRQNAVKHIIKQVELLLVIGSKNSSNSNRLRDLGVNSNTPSYMINSASDIEIGWFENIASVGITAGASAPEHLVQDVIRHLKSFFDIKIYEQNYTTENINFKLPKELLST